MQPALDGKGRGDQEQSNGRKQRNRATVVRIEQSAAVEAQGNKRNEGTDAQNADRQRRAGDSVHLKADCHQRQLTAEIRATEPPPEPPELHARSKRRQIEKQRHGAATLNRELKGLSA